MDMARYARNLNLIKVIMLCCDCCCITTCYATYRCYTVKHTCTTEAPQPPACYQCHIQPHAITNCNIATLHEVPQHSIDATLPYITHNTAQLLTVAHPASAAVLQRLGCVNTGNSIASTCSAYWCNPSKKSLPTRTPPTYILILSTSVLHFASSISGQ